MWVFEEQVPPRAPILCACTQALCAAAVLLLPHTEY
jgi:hypothetical protein